MKKLALFIVAAAFVLIAGGAAYLYSMSGAGDDPAFFEGEIQAFEAADFENPPERGGIVFVGSSSIRFWSTLEEDMAPLSVLNRGFGGAHFIHVVHNTPRIVLPYAPRAVVVYAGDNDIGAGTSVAEVVAGYREFVDQVHRQLPESKIYYLPIKPSKARWSSWSLMSEANGEIAAIAAKDDRLEVLDVATPLLGEGGEPRDDVFILDGLHMNEAGYAEWTSVVRPALMADFGE